MIGCKICEFFFKKEIKKESDFFARTGKVTGKKYE